MPHESGTGTLNEEFFDALVRHQVYLMRLSGSIRNKISAVLDKTEADIADKIRSRLLNNQGLNTAGLRRLQALEKYIKSVRLKAWDQVNETWLEEIVALAQAEPATVAAALKTVSPVLLDLALPAPAVLKALVTSKPFEGRTLKQWAQSIAEADLQRIMDQIKIGMVQGETSKQIARRVVGSAQLRGTDGITEITRRQAAAITRTAVNHISNAAKREFYKANADIFEGELYVATLDSRTTAVCRANDGEIFEVGKGPIPPLHFNCRSLRVGIVDGEIIGQRPMREFTQKQLLREYAQREGFKVPTSRNGLPHGHKTAFDQFARGRMRELTGQVPAKTSYQQWLTRQTREFQEDVLGKTKARLFREGKLTLDKFVNRAGDELNLSQLATRHADAFRAAGLDPEDFL